MKINLEQHYAPDRGTHFQGVDKASAGYKLLSGMGWKEGEGLGAQKQGMASHVKVSKKSDNSGVGVVQEARTARDWTVGMTAYEKILAALKPLTEEDDRPKKKKRKTEKASAQLVTPELPAVGEAKGSTKGSKKKKSKENPSGKGTELKVTVTRVSHAGRFQKRVKNKLVTGYSSNDLSAILGERLVEQVTSSAEPDSPPQPANKQKIFEVLAEPMQTVEDVPERSEDSNVAETGPIWWQGYFQQAGGVGGGQGAYAAFQPAQREVNAANFSEQDQANLWHNVTDAQNKNRQGLGKPSGPLKVGGAKWQGTRTVIQDQADAGSQEPLQPTLPSHSDAGVDMSSAPVKKCKKVARQILAERDGGQMRLKEFRLKLGAQLASRHGAVSDATLDVAIAKLGQSSQFLLENKRISIMHQ